ncbi:MAG TPA: hypothetical protein VGE07_02680 [Herpetosiphonaceae bacterium]
MKHSRMGKGWRPALAALALIGGLALSGCGAGSATSDPGSAATAYVTALDKADTDEANRLLSSKAEPWPAGTRAEQLGKRCQPSGSPNVTQTNTFATVELACASGNPRMVMLREEAGEWKVLTR